MRTTAALQAHRPLFPLGRLLITRGAQAALEQANRSPAEFIRRHQSGDYGDLDAEDRDANQAALRDGSRLLSSYVIDANCTLWIITEADRSAFTHRLSVTRRSDRPIRRTIRRFIMFMKAQRTQAKLRLALCGPSGSGKTYSALLLARGLAPDGQIALLDTERGSGQLYAHLTEYDVAPLSPPFTPDRYIELIKQAEANGYAVLIIDSLSHAWSGEGGILDMHDKATLASRAGNSFAAWREVTPKHNQLVDTLISANLHVIVTLRTKTAYDLTDDGSGKKRPIKVGLAPIQRDGLEYEFTVVMDLSVDGHIATAAKDRTGLFDGAHWVPSLATGDQLRHWLTTGLEVTELSRRLLEKFKGQVSAIDNVPHLNSWWRATQDAIAQLLPPHVDALKALCAERREAIQAALNAPPAETPPPPRRRTSRPAVAA